MTLKLLQPGHPSVRLSSPSACLSVHTASCQARRRHRSGLPGAWTRARERERGCGTLRRAVMKKRVLFKADDNGSRVIDDRLFLMKPLKA